MRFALLIYTNEKASPTPGDDDIHARYGAFTAEIMANGKMQAGDALLPSATALTARVRDGESVITAGPFAETAEQLGGYYILECKDADEALSFALKVPGAAFGSVEVRPVMEM